MPSAGVIAQVTTPGSQLPNRIALLQLPESSLDQEKQLPSTLDSPFSIKKDYHAVWLRSTNEH